MKSKSITTSLTDRSNLLYSEHIVMKPTPSAVTFKASSISSEETKERAASDPQTFVLYQGDIEWQLDPMIGPNKAQYSAAIKRRIGIPTFEGYEFVLADQIIRCEGLQKCTRIFIKDRTAIVSSYSIGAFEKLLTSHDFFLVHKSHLINLSCMVRYRREGTIDMCDNSTVPVSRRKKKGFLDQFNRL